MEKPINASYRLTMDELMQVQQLASRTAWWVALDRATDWVFPVFGCFMLASAVYGCLIRYPNVFNFITGATISVFLIALPFLKR